LPGRNRSQQRRMIGHPHDVPKPDDDWLLDHKRFSACPKSADEVVSPM
jgi:hypothetical protein